MLQTIDSGTFGQSEIPPTANMSLSSNNVPQKAAFLAVLLTTGVVRENDSV